MATRLAWRDGGNHSLGQSHYDERKMVDMEVKGHVGDRVIKIVRSNLQCRVVVT